MTATLRRQKKAEQTRSLILTSAALRFAERGYSETRLEEIGQDVGIGRSAVLYHFKDKQFLYRAVLDDLFGGLLVAMRSSLTAAGTLAERIEAAVSAFVDYMGHRPTAARLAVRESLNADSESREELQRQARPRSRPDAIWIPAGIVLADGLAVDGHVGRLDSERTGFRA